MKLFLSRLLENSKMGSSRSRCIECDGADLKALDVNSQSLAINRDFIVPYILERLDETHLK